MSAATTILVVDDEESFRLALEQALKNEGFVVHSAADGETALRQFDAVKPDVVLLDVMLPQMSGLDVCRHIRAKHATPVIMVSAKGEEIDTVVALEVGADDYITKPYRLRELVARVRTILRRAATTSAPTAASSDTGHERSRHLEVGPLSLDRERHEVWCDGERVELPLKEFQLLTELMQHAGYVVTRLDLINRVWGYDYIGDTKTLDVHIKRLRARFEDDPTKPELITTIRGLGYKMAAD